MRVTRRYRAGPTPATVAAARRSYAVHAERRRARPFRVELTAQGSMATESVAELVVFVHRARTNQAPLATGRYRR